MLPKQERPPFTSSKKLDLLAWGSLLLTAVAMVMAITAAAVDGDWMSIAAATFLLVVSVCIIVLLLRRHSPKEPPQTKVFQPFGKLDIDTVWRRPADTQRIVEAIHDSGDALPVVVGSSGAGKTTLLEVMVKEALGSDVAYQVIYDGYEGLRTKLPSLIPDPDMGDETIIVLDQFEQWLTHVKHEKGSVRKEEREWLKTVLCQARSQPNCTVLLSIRREWYYDLRFLGDLIPRPGDACGIEGPEAGTSAASTSNDMRLGMVSSFNEVVKDKGLAETILERIGIDGRLSPLEVQLVGAFVESRIDNGDSFSLEYFDEGLSGAHGAIDAFLELILNGAERPSLCMKILCALSLKTRFREQTALLDIRAGLYERDEAVNKAAAYLAWHGLVIEHSGGAYELAHDFLAEWFNSKSGTELNPIERDNILACIGAGGKHNDLLFTPEQLKEKGRIRWGLITVISLLAVMAVRLVFCSIDPHLVGPSLTHPVAGSFLDSSYILVITPYAAWIVYVSLFYDRVLIYLNEPHGAHLFSVFIVINLIISTLLGMVIPVAWLLGITTGGLAFAAKLIWLSCRPDLNRSAQKRLGEYWRPTLFNLLFVGFAGAAGVYAGIRYVQGDDHLGTWLIINLAASVIMTYWCLILIPRHVSRSGVSQLLGLIGRPNSVAIASSDA